MPTTRDAARQRRPPPHRRGASTAVVAALAVTAVIPTWSVAAAAGRPAPSSPAVGAGGQADFAAAAHEFGVPEPLLLAYSYAWTSWDAHDRPSADGGYGPLHLTAPDGVAAPRGGDQPAGRAAGLATDPTLTTLARAAALLRLPADRLRSDPAQNIRAGAALLADEARRLHGGRLPTSLDDWHTTVATLSGGADRGRVFADDVYEFLRTGAERTTLGGAHLRLAAVPGVSPHRDPAASPTPRSGVPAAECPPTPDMHCRFIPAAYKKFCHPHRPTECAYGNYDPANRPADGNRIRSIVIHTTDGSYSGAINWFQNPQAQASAHYVIRSSDGQITQMVRTKDIAWHPANWSIGVESIGIEHEAMTENPDRWFTDKMYQSSAKLVRYLAARYHIPLDRRHIIGHEDVINSNHPTDSHWDPGPFWDWDRYMKLLGSPESGSPPAPRGYRPGQVVTITPDYATNRPRQKFCEEDAQQHRTCWAKKRPSNAVYLHTEPREDAPLLSDAYASHGQPGTISIDDWSDKAVWGRQYVVAARCGDWTGIYYGGQVGWLYDPGGVNTRPASDATVRARPGLSDLHPYAIAVPGPNEYPQGVPPRLCKILKEYHIPAGQRYVKVTRQRAASYYARFNGDPVPHNHTMIWGSDIYVLISYNHRYMYVQAADVQQN